MVVILRHAIATVAVLICLLIALIVVWLVGLRLLLVAIASNRPGTATTWLMVDFNTSLVVLGVIMLVHSRLAAIL